jgi:hypothetical protein
VRYANVRTTIAQAANIRHLFFCGNCHKTADHFQQLWQFVNGCTTIGLSQPSQRDMPMDKSELEAESKQIR